MAEFCLSCFNEMNDTHYTKSEVWLEEDFCEGCAEWKPCVIELRPKPLLLRLFDTIIGLFKKDKGGDFRSPPTTKSRESN